MKRRAKILCCLFLVLLTLQLSSASGDWLHDELSSIHQEIDSLRVENHNQNIQIAFLKEKAGLQDEPDHYSRQVSTDLSENVKHHEEIMKESPQLLTAKRFPHHRQERPARLLPLQVLRRKMNGTEKKISRFYGEPTNCTHLSQLGYTLNGFYLVKSSDSLDTSGLLLETVFCSFKQPEGRPFNSSALEKRIGFLKLDDDVDDESPISSSSSATIDSNNSSGTEPSISSSSVTNNSHNNSSGRLMFHLQIKNSSNVTQRTGDKLNFDLILSNFENSYDQKNKEFLVPITGYYNFVFEGKILAKSVPNITFRYAGRYRPPEYKYGSTLKIAEASDMTNNTVKMETTRRLLKSSKIQLKTNDNPNKTPGTYILSADNFASFRAYLIP